MFFDTEEPPSTGTEAAMLRSELEENFKRYSGHLALYLPADFYNPVDVVLAGTYKLSPDDDDSDKKGKIHIWQRAFPEGLQHMIITENGNKRAWRRVTPTDVTEVWSKGKSLPPSEIQQIQWRIGVTAAEWSLADAEQTVADAHMSPYEHSRIFTGQ